MKTVAIDIGNTRIKTAIFENNIIFKKFDFDNFDNLLAFIKEFDIDIPAIVSDVTNSNVQAFYQYFKKLIILNSKTQIPITNNYKTPDTLGNDRLAAVIGASAIFINQNILVIDAGTCIKYDFIDKNKIYNGGSISPGLEMKFQALNRFTQKLPLENKNHEFSYYGNSTSDAIISGVMQGTYSEMCGIIGEYKSRFENLKIIFTGGDMFYFADKIKEVIFADPDLVLKGLYEVLKYNVK